VKYSEAYMPGYRAMWTCLGFYYWLLLTWRILVCTTEVLHHHCYKTLSGMGLWW